MTLLQIINTDGEPDIITLIIDANKNPAAITSTPG